MLTMTNTMTPIRMLLREVRKASGMTQHQLAERSGVPQSTISEAERGAANLTLATLEKLADALGVNVSTLFVHEAGSAGSRATPKRGRRA